MVGAHRYGTVESSIMIRGQSDGVWKKLSKIDGLAEWVAGVAECRIIGRAKRLGAVRIITFDDGLEVEEYITHWNEGESFTYAAVSGLPLRSYVATISVSPQGGKSMVTWGSRFNTQKMTANEYAEFKSYMEKLYAGSLRNLKGMFE